MAAMKQGDWLCAGCGDHQFAKNTACRRCGAPRADEGGAAEAWGGAEAWGAAAAWGGGAGGAAAWGGAAGGGGGAGAGAGVANAKPGDWFCASCGDLQFARNTACRKCGAPNPASGGGWDAGWGAGAWGGGGAAACWGGGGAAAMGGANMKPGDWMCPNCGDHVFGRNDACRKCGTPKAAGGKGASPWMMTGGGGCGGQTPKPGDWNCPSCGDLQFARNTECRKCGEAKPDNPTLTQGGGMQAGDWACPACGDHQFARNAKCRKCGAEKPAEQLTGRERSRSPIR